MKKQTAVEWLVGDLNQKIDFIPMDKWDMIRDIVQEALAMEKEQMKECAVNVLDSEKEVIRNFIKDQFEKYYNETFNNTQS